MNRTLKKVAYGVVFVIALPAALLLWARGSAAEVNLPAVQPTRLGLLLAVCGVCAMLAGMAALWRRGGGLPMNAFPPPRFVSSGIYSLAPHPIYGGFVMVCAGAAIYAGSASGLWLVTPLVAMGCAALVLGYELPDLRARFGGGRESAWLPRAHSGAPEFVERVRIYFAVLLPWLACYELIGLLGRAPDAVSTYFGFEYRLPVIEWTEAVYASTYVLVLAAPMLIATGNGLRRFATRGLTAMALIFPLYLLLPFFVPPRPFDATTAMGQILLLERTPISGAAAMPSFHVVWALIAASALGEGSRAKRVAWLVWAALVAVSCVTTGMHSIADVFAGVAAFVLVARMPAIWRGVLRVAEKIANSWREWRIGPVRIINHGGYAAAASFVGLLAIASLLGRGGAWLALSICVCSQAGAILWAQLVEGSPALLRPMGFYGGMLGALVGALPALWVGVDMWSALAAVCVAAPWIQLLGRLRCLVQGCCHGRPVDGTPGICYTHPRSRVCRLTKFGGLAIHATPVYSIVWNAAVGAALIRLVALHTSSAMLCGVYLLLSGCGRFVEEAYRGEPQTRITWGLRFYQWIAVATVMLGAAMTCAHGSRAPEAAAPGWDAWLLALGFGALTWFVSGVDFPESSRRFARLT